MQEEFPDPSSVSTSAPLIPFESALTSRCPSVELAKMTDEESESCGGERMMPRSVWCHVWGLRCTVQVHISILQKSSPHLDALYFLHASSFTTYLALNKP